MVNRKSNSPWGSSYKEGLPSRAVDSSVNVDQNVRATITTGVIDVRTGQWQGIRLSDEQFTIDASHDAVANGAAVLSPQRSNEDFIDMTGYNDLLIALKVSQGGAYAIAAVMGPDTNMYANLTPLNAGSLLRGNMVTSPQDFNTTLVDSSESLTANVWNIYSIHTNLKNQKLVQFQITNNSGGPSNIEFAYMRVV